MTLHVLVLNGPDLNPLGERDPLLFGTVTLAEIGDLCRHLGLELGLEITSRYEAGAGRR